jgi:ATP-binding cassette subfamily B (MDR/TAP) protein 1
MAFGASMKRKMFMGEDEGIVEAGEQTPGAIVVETLLNVRTVASLNMEETRAQEFDETLTSEDPHRIQTNLAKGLASSLGQFVQMWGYKATNVAGMKLFYFLNLNCLTVALMLWWGGWLLLNYPNQ